MLIHENPSYYQGLEFVHAFWVLFMGQWVKCLQILYLDEQRGILKTSDRTMTMSEIKFYNPDSYENIPYDKDGPHSPECIQEHFDY